MVNIREIKLHANLHDVWSALGGGELRGGRGKAFWRGGHGHSVALDLQRGLWHDHRDGVGGDIVTLVEVARNCSFREAIAWLSDFTGISASGQARHQHVDNAWASDLKWATWWKIAAEVLAEWALEELPPWHPERRGLTALLHTIRLGDASLVGEYRRWRKMHPQMTAALEHTGRLHDARIQRRLARWLRRYLDEQQTA